MNAAVYSVIGIGDTAGMKPESAALTAISVDAPSLSRKAVARAVEAQFGLAGEFAPLVSERDQNFMLRTAAGESYVAKVTSRYEDAAASDFQIGALLHLEEAGGPVVPQVCRTLTGQASGEISDEHGSYRLRVVTWLDGKPLELCGIDTGSATALGTALAHLDQAFMGYSHPGENPALLWDLQRALELRQVVGHIDDPAVRHHVVRAVDDFATNVQPVVSQLRSQVIHSDANPGNVLIVGDSVGFIDFGDIVKAPLVFDVAIAASYLRSFEADPLQFIVPCVAAYHAVASLHRQEADLLFDLIRARLATTITLLYWRLSTRAEDDPYRQKALALESGAEQFLALLDAFGRDEFRQKLSFIQ